VTNNDKNVLAKGTWTNCLKFAGLLIYTLDYCTIHSKQSSTNKEIVDSRLRPQSQWSRGKSTFLPLAYARPCDFSVGYLTSRHCLFTNNCHAHWHAIGEILACDWSARIIYVVWQIYRQSDCITSLPLAGEVINNTLKTQWIQYPIKWFAALPILGTGYPVAITRVPGPGFNFWVSKEKWQCDNAYTPNYGTFFTNLCFLLLVMLFIRP